ncbi:MAG: hypothetical protein AMXMBFR16_11350 [Candidatus Uhrbacteria bacterium]
MRDNSGNRHQIGNHTYCSDCYNTHFVNCYECGTPVERYDAYSLNEDGSEQVCRTCYERHFVGCHECGRSVVRENAVVRNSRSYCEDCGGSEREWDQKEFEPETVSYDIIGSKRSFGIELETSRCDGYRRLYDKTIWAAKPDCSIEGMEFVSPVLYGDQGIAEVANFCGIAAANRWQINRHCGYHAHFDVGGESWERLRSIAYAYCMTYPMWCALVTDQRSNNPMCGAPDYQAAQLRGLNSESDWEYFVGGRDRFQFINWRAFLVHGTLEIRTHDASLDANEINNWVMLHARFIDFVATLSCDDIDTLFGRTVSDNFAGLREIVGSSLADFYAERAQTFGKPVAASLTPVTRERRMYRTSATA